MKVLSDRTAADLVRLLRERPSLPARRVRIAHGVGAAADHVVPAIVTASEGVSWSEGVAVDLYGNGFLSDPTGSGVAYLPEVGSRTVAKEGMAILCHSFSSFVVPGDRGTVLPPEDEEA